MKHNLQEFVLFDYLFYSFVEKDNKDNKIVLYIDPLYLYLIEQ